ncbi:MAG: DnaA/Hda family protein [Candidatus Edwardsbacteria bacterium]
MLNPENQEVSLLDSHYTFESFIIGGGNRLAYAACKKVAESPGTLYNPLFIYSGVGLGKSHLLQAIGNSVQNLYPEWKVFCLNGAKFAEEDLTKIKGVNLWLIDDFQLLLPESHLQLRLLPIFDLMLALDRQIVVTADTLPYEMKGLDKKLLSRFQGGLIVGIKDLSHSDRIAILKKKAATKNFSLKEEVAGEIAKRVISNVRELEGALNRAMLYASILNEGELHLEMIDEIFPLTLVPQMPKAVLETKTEKEIAVGGKNIEEISGEFGDFLFGVQSKVAGFIKEQQKEDNLRKDYKEKIYIWKMKGFNVANLEGMIEFAPIEEVSREFLEFTNNVQRLYDLQGLFGQLVEKAKPEEIASIESKLFDPKKADVLETEIRALEKRILGQSFAKEEKLKEEESKEIALPSPITSEIEIPEEKFEFHLGAHPEVGLLVEDWEIFEERLEEAY